MAEKIQLRRGTLAQAVALNNVILDAGEPGYFTDLKCFVTGDGITLVQNLPRIFLGAQAIQNWIMIVGQSGGGATKLDGVATAEGAVAVGTKVEINDADGSRWRLDVGTGADVNVADKKVVPVDYSPGTPVVWTRYA
jgi:hypothetical protein